MKDDASDDNTTTNNPLDSSDTPISSRATSATSAQDPTDHDGPHQEPEDVFLWPLVNGGVTKISPQDVDAVAQRVWRAVKIAGHSYAYTTLNHRRVYLHRLLCGESRYWDESKGKWRTNHVDHVDNDGLNNTRPNLRSCTPQENQRNGAGRVTARRSRFKGVSYCKGAKNRPWRATIHICGRQLHIGYFDSEEEAAQMYNDKAREWFGKFARLNPC